MKIKNSGIASYFQEVIITQKDKTENLKNILASKIRKAKEEETKGRKSFRSSLEKEQKYMPGDQQIPTLGL